MMSLCAGCTISTPASASTSPPSSRRWKPQIASSCSSPYWFSSPPLLKKWEDDVLTYGWAYGSTGNALAGKELLVACSPGSSKYGRESDYIYTVHEFLRPFQASANLCSLTYLKPFLTIGAMAISDEHLAKRVEDYETTLKANSLPTLSDFD